MTFELNFGRDATLTLDLPPGVVVAACGKPADAPLADPCATTLKTLAEPIDYPALRSSVVPGDKVVLALDPDVPRRALIVAAIVAALEQAGVALADITVLRSHQELDHDVEDPLGELPAATRQVVRLVTHLPEERDRLSYLASSAENKPIYINRAITDADLVIPVGCLRVDGALGYHGFNSPLFPIFSDAKSIERYRAPAAVESVVQSKRMRKEVDEVAWLLGVHFAVEVLPGPGGEVLQVLAGRLSSVGQLGTRLCDETWRSSVPHRASLVVAAIPGPAGQQTWQHVARALAAAGRAVEDGGTIALCTELAELPGPALRGLASVESPETVLRAIARERPVDALAATQLAQALTRGRVYLLSQLDDSLVEDLGIAPVSDAADIGRLAARHESCILLANAQLALAVPQDEPATAARPPQGIAR